MTFDLPISTECASDYYFKVDFSLGCTRPLDGSNFLTGQTGMEIQPNPEVYMISRCHHEHRDVKIISVRENFDDLSSLQIVAETMQMIQDTRDASRHQKGY